jgi:hypothetical protein
MPPNVIKVRGVDACEESRASEITAVSTVLLYDSCFLFPNSLA